MSGTTLGELDVNIDTLRGAVAAVDRDVRHVARAATETERKEAVRRLVTSWSAVTKMLALGPEPAPLECTHCGHTVAVGAARCGHCWIELTG